MDGCRRAVSLAPVPGALVVPAAVVGAGAVFLGLFLDPGGLPLPLRVAAPAGDWKSACPDRPVVLAVGALERGTSRVGGVGASESEVGVLGLLSGIGWPLLGHQR